MDPSRLLPLACVTAFLVACEAPAATSPKPVTIPPTPIAASVASPPAVPPASSAPAPKPPATEVKEVPFPTTPCLVDAAPPPPTPKPSTDTGFSHVFLDGVSIAHVSAFGKLRRVRLAFEEGSPSSAALEIDGEIMRAKGTVPLRDGSSADLDLYPRTRIVRDGWLEYHTARIVSVHDAKAEPHADLPSWLTADFSSSPYLVPCADLTPFGAPKSVDDRTMALLGAKVVLEDERGKKVATVDAPNDGIPVRVLAAKGGRSKIRFEVGTRTIAEVWVASRQVKATQWGGLGYGTGHGRLAPLAKITCDAETPLHVRVNETTYAWGTLHAKQSVEGKRAPDGSFALVRLGGQEEYAPFVPAGEMNACHVP